MIEKTKYLVRYCYYGKGLNNESMVIKAFSKAEAERKCLHKLENKGIHFPSIEEIIEV